MVGTVDRRTTGGGRHPLTSLPTSPFSRPSVRVLTMVRADVQDDGRPWRAGRGATRAPHDRHMTGIVDTGRRLSRVRGAGCWGCRAPAIAGAGCWLLGVQGASYRGCRVLAVGGAGRWAVRPRRGARSGYVAVIIECLSACLLPVATATAPEPRLLLACLLGVPGLSCARPWPTADAVVVRQVAAKDAKGGRSTVSRGAVGTTAAGAVCWCGRYR